MMHGDSPWSAQQRRWLQALGHAVWRMGAAADGGLAGAPDEIVGEAPAPARPRPEPPRSPHPPVAEAMPRRVPAAAPAAAPESVASDASARASMRRPARLPDRLQLAMLRASGLDPADPAAQAAMAQWPVERLRGDAAAKRAFWPQLRALRRRPS